MKPSALKIYTFLLCLGAILLAVCLGANYLRSLHTARSHSDFKRIDQYLNEIGTACFNFGVIGTLAPRQDEVYYIYRRTKPSQLCKLSLITGQTISLPVDRSVQRLFNWSPQQRFLLFKTENDNYEPTPNGGYAKPEWFLAYDRDTGKMLSVTQKKMLLSSHAVWLDDELFLYSASLFANPNASQKAYVARLVNGAFQSQELPVPANALAALSSRSKLVSSCGGTVVAFASEDAIRFLDLASGLVTPAQALSNGNFTGFNWLTFSPETRRLLFCATKAGETYRNVFAYDLAQEATERLSTVHSYNGQWLQGGKGYAFVGKDQDFYLAIRPRDEAGETNLHTKGFIDSYAAAAGGDYVVAIAATNGEPRSLWRYDLATKSLDCLKPAGQVPFKFTKIAEARGLSVRAADGLNIPVYLFPPTDGRAVKKHPLVVYIPPRTGPAHRGYEMRPQLLSNLGFYYAGINYRGCDGYGASYAGQWNEEKAAGDVFQAIQELGKEFQCDTQNVFAVAASAGSSVLQSFLRQFPTVLRGAVFVGPVPWELDQWRETERLPRLFVSIGRNDSEFRFVQSFEAWAKLHRVSASFQYVPNYAHFDLDVPKRVAQERAVAEFLLKNVE
jgi:pimeloyl-ACP methyl ester carboxylesterase